MRSLARFGLGLLGLAFVAYPLVQGDDCAAPVVDPCNSADGPGGPTSSQGSLRVAALPGMPAGHGQET